MTKPQEHTNKEKKMFKIRNFIKNNKPFVIITLSCLLLPMIIELFINYGESKITYGLKPFFLKILYTLKEYKSYYATILTFSFAIFSYIQQQEEMLEEKQKENELKEKERDDKKDYYRPVFVVEKDEYNPSKNQVRLLMKNETLYLENIIIHSKSHRTFGQEKQCKSGEIIESNITSGSFYITAQTLVGETILFGYLNGGVKVYKYLNHNKDPKYPTKDTIINEYNKDKINETWGSYNKTSDEYDITLEQFFFNATSHIRNEYLFNYKNAEFKRILYTNTYEEFFEKAFWALDDFLTFCAPDKIKVARRVFQLIDILIKKEPDLDLVVNSDISKRLEDYCKDDSQLDTVKQEIEKCKPNNNSNFDISSFLNFLYTWNLKIIHKKEDKDNIIKLVKILIITFSSIKVTSKSNEQLNKVKDIILTL
ncbi:hypothetical protein ACWOBW_09070 [Gemella sanguinis]